MTDRQFELLSDQLFRIERLLEDIDKSLSGTMILRSNGQMGYKTPKSKLDIIEAKDEKLDYEKVRMD